MKRRVRKGQRKTSAEEKKKRGMHGAGGDEEEEKEGRRKRSVWIPPEEVEKCDLVRRPGDISSTHLIDF